MVEKVGSMVTGNSGHRRKIGLGFLGGMITNA